MSLSFQDRAKVIGSSDAVKIMGDADDWIELYRQKTDPVFFQKQRAEIDASLMVMVGNTLEPLHLMLLGQKLGVVIETLPGEERISHPTIPYLVDRPDGYVRDVRIDNIVRYGRSPVEVKACGGWQMAHERLEHYYPQIQHHLAFGGEGCVFSMLIGTQQQHFCYVERDDGFIAHYLDRCERFVVDHLAKRTPPVSSAIGAAKYRVPDGLVPKVYKLEDMDEADQKEWKAIAASWLRNNMDEEDLAERQAKTKDRAVKAMAKLVDPKTVHIGTMRCSLTKAGVIQWRDVSKTGDE